MNTSMPTVAANLAVDAKADFILKTYAHLFGAVMAFVLFEYWLFESGLWEPITAALLSVNWLLVLGGFILVSWLASHAAHRVKSTAAQYAMFAVFIAVWGVLFVPMLYIADQYAPGAIQNAAIATIVGFAVLTAIVFKTRKNFSFLAPMLMWGGVAAIGAIVISVFTGASLGLWFSAAMVVYAGGAILYDTSNVLHEYGPGQHVSAAMQLFASIALLFWYVLRLFMSSDS